MAPIGVSWVGAVLLGVRALRRRDLVVPALLADMPAVAEGTAGTRVETRSAPRRTGRVELQYELSVTSAHNKLCECRPGRVEEMRRTAVAGTVVVAGVAASAVSSAVKPVAWDIAMWRCCRKPTRPMPTHVSGSELNRFNRSIMRGWRCHH